ncbi:endonuclease domain-containing protein [Cryptosporangium phraense]|uniref:DUF559 domain-containing protein n=1 Tax=Cryptosporangium phraense TaxID=2593070 RepID=A0A545ANT4_9ACTN|nr:hypothetical protein [Cryptosporangium phraense]TQS42405.1 hypothetical protein FL583_24150 [Cryptosporangium phraense]
MRGLPLGEPRDPVVAIAPPGTGARSGRGIRLRRAVLKAEEIRRGRLPTTVPIRTAWEIAGERDLVEAVVALDVLLRHRHVRAEQLTARASAHPQSRAARAIALADGRAESPPESRTRVRIVLAGLPAPVPQFEITRGGVLLGRVDFAWPAYRVALEYDGLWHADRGQFIHDRHRLNALTADRWTVLHATLADLHDKTAFDRLLTQLRAALGRA